MRRQLEEDAEKRLDKFSDATAPDTFCVGTDFLTFKCDATSRQS